MLHGFTTSFSNARVGVQFLPLSCSKRLNRCLARRRPRRAASSRIRVASSDEANTDFGMVEQSVEQSVDFSELEFIEVQDADTCASFRTVQENGVDAEVLSFSTAEVTVPSDVVLETETVSSDDGRNGLWILCLCTIAYLHCCSTGFSVPALLPSIAADVSLTDLQASFLTVGFTVVFAICQVPFGFLADKVDRPKLLASGLVVWSMVTVMSSKASSFSDLFFSRLSTGAAQSMQNPIVFGLLPEIFPKGSTTAMSFYNCALYFGRALSYLFALILSTLGMHGALGISTIPLEQFDVDTMSLLYISGNQATVAPVFDYDFRIIADATSWRDLLFWIGIPGLGVAILLSMVPDPRRAKQPGVEEGPPKQGLSDMWPTVQTIVSNRGFRAVGLATALNDIGFWSLISWQAIYYERVYDIHANIYAPLLAAIIPISGIIGGVGGSLVADWLKQRNARYVLTGGATILGSPLIFMSFQAGDYQSSFVYLLFGYLLLECWRASAAVMICEASPPGTTSTAAAIQLFARNLIASVGPLLIAALEPKFGLRNAICVIPLSYLASGIMFTVAEKLLDEERAKRVTDSTS